MIRISIPWIVETVKYMDDLDRLSDDSKQSDLLSSLFLAHSRLSLFYNQSFYKDHVKASQSAANELYSVIDEILNRILEKKSEAPDDHFLGRLKEKKKYFLDVFVAELSVIPVYLATPKEGYDIDRIISDGSCIFPSAISLKAPDAAVDLKEAGKALAFELPTACGFHVFRATECVVRRYWDIVSKGKERPSLETLGNFAAEMEKTNLETPKLLRLLSR